MARSPRWRRQHEVSGAQARQQQRQPPPRRVASACLGSPIRALRDPRCMFTLPSFTEQFPLPPPFSTRLGASRRASWGNPQQTARLPFQPSLNRGGLVGAGRWCAYEGRQREEGKELCSCGLLLLSLWGMSSNGATTVALGGAAGTRLALQGFLTRQRHVDVTVTRGFLTRRRVRLGAEQRELEKGAF